MTLNKILDIFKSKKPNPKHYIIAQLNDKLMPIDRGLVYSDPIDEYLISKSLGEVSGGGTLQSESGEIEYCELEIELNNKPEEDLLIEIINILEALGAPKGSKLTIEGEDRQIPFGKKEGIGLYLNGISLDPKVYAENDINVLFEELYEQLEIPRKVDRFWEGHGETALYFYGNNFEKMNQVVTTMVKKHPLCEKARLAKIA
ncbi:MAG: hypothetical protein IR153_02760 [Flavobacterium sp.]|nr:hypothetical protein [Flavobacterium sp.]